MNKKGWVIYSRKETNNSTFKNNAFDWMLLEARKNNLEAIIQFEEDLQLNCTSEDFKFLNKGKEIEKPDFVLLRTYCLSLAKELEKANIPVFNSSSSLFNCRNKWISSEICLKHQIPMPLSILGDDLNFQSIGERLGVPFVVKELIGSKGEQVYLVEEENQLIKLRKEINSPVLYQEFISESSGKDLRVHVIGDKAIAGIKRSSNQGFKSNYSLGGTSEIFELSEEAKQIAIEAAKAHELDMAGVDLLFSKDGFKVCEVNGIAGFRTVAKDSDINLPYLIFKHIATSIYQ